MRGMRTTRFAIVLGLIETSWRGTHGLPEKSLIQGELAADIPHWGRRSSHWQNHYQLVHRRRVSRLYSRLSERSPGRRQSFMCLITTEPLFFARVPSVPPRLFPLAPHLVPRHAPPAPHRPCVYPSTMQKYTCFGLIAWA